MQLHQPRFLAQLEKLDAHLLVVSFAGTDYFRRWIIHFHENILAPAFQERGLAVKTPFQRTHFLADPELKAYRAYGLGRHRAGTVYSPKILGQYARWLIQGRPAKPTGQDTLQRGGDFVIGRDGRLTLAHTGRDQSERPSVQEILAALRQG